MGEFETVFFAAVTLVSRQFFCQYPSFTSVLITIGKVFITRHQCSILQKQRSLQTAYRLFNALSMSRLTKHVMNSNLSNLVIALAYPRARGMRLNIFKYCLASFLFQHTFSN